MSERLERLFGDDPDSVEPVVVGLDRRRFVRVTRTDWSDAELDEIEARLAAGRRFVVPNVAIVPTGRAALSLFGSSRDADAQAETVRSVLESVRTDHEAILHANLPDLPAS